MAAATKPARKKAHKGSLKRRTQIKGMIMRKSAWTKLPRSYPDRSSTEFADVKTSAKATKAVAREKE